MLNAISLRLIEVSTNVNGAFSAPPGIIVPIAYLPTYLTDASEEEPLAARDWKPWLRSTLDHVDDLQHLHHITRSESDCQRP